MRRLRLTAAAVIGCATLALAPASALALSPVTGDCETHGHLTKHYSATQLQHALKTMPTTIAEYGNCQQIIQTQLDTELGKHIKLNGGHASRGGSSSGGSSSTVLIIVIAAVVVLICAGGGLLFWRRRTGGEDSADPPPPSA
jgi:hypothetical protein